MEWNRSELFGDASVFRRLCADCHYVFRDLPSACRDRGSLISFSLRPCLAILLSLISPLPGVPQWLLEEDKELLDGKRLALAADVYPELLAVAYLKNDRLHRAVSQIQHAAAAQASSACSCVLLPYVLRVAVQSFSLLSTRSAVVIWTPLLHQLVRWSSVFLVLSRGCVLCLSVSPLVCSSRSASCHLLSNACLSLVLNALSGGVISLTLSACSHCCHHHILTFPHMYPHGHFSHLVNLFHTCCYSRSRLQDNGPDRRLLAMALLCLESREDDAGIDRETVLKSRDSECRGYTTAVSCNAIHKNHWWERIIGEGDLSAAPLRCCSCCPCCCSCLMY